ncbi:MAG: 3D domain-containing protein [Deltaproteobacteria bacterium]|nr:3D domain-containing protein [Deltaproteobacteria bacterium]
MNTSTMRLALCAAALVIGAVGLNTSVFLVSGDAEHAVSVAEASIPPQVGSARFPRPGTLRIGPSDLVGRLHGSGAVSAHDAVHATAHVIPADLPEPPLGRFKLTAYSGPQLGQALPITATGTTARAGRTVAVDPAVIPLGSRIYIEGVGERVAEDVGGGVKGNHIDVYLGTVPQAFDFGVRRGRVSLVETPKSRLARRLSAGRS